MKKIMLEKLYKSLIEIKEETVITVNEDIAHKAMGSLSKILELPF